MLFERLKNNMLTDRWGGGGEACQDLMKSGTVLKKAEGDREK